MTNQSRVWIKRVGDALLGVLIVGTAIVGVYIRSPVDQETHVVAAFLLNLIQDHATLVLVSLAVATGGAKFVLWKIGQPWAQESIEAILDEIYNLAFNSDVADDPVHHHRVTFFKYAKKKYWIPRASWRGALPWGSGRGPGSGWLVPVLRTGHATQRMTSVFLAPDDADNAEGIAGRTWSQRGTAYAPDLPELSELTSENNIQRYAQRTNVSEKLVRKWMRQGKHFPRCLCGFPILYRGTPLGVIVLDSRRPDGIRPPIENRAVIAMAQKLLPTLIRAA